MPQTNKSEAGKARWAECEILAEKLRITKYKAHNYLYQILKTKGWLEDVKSGNQAIIDQVKQLPEWARMLAEPAPRILRADEEEEEDELPTTRRKYGRGEKVTTPDEKLRVAMWYLNKFETPEEAQKALDVAILAHKKLK